MLNLDIFKDNYMILIIGLILVILIINSWMLPIIVISSICGYYSFVRFQFYLTRFLIYLNERDKIKDGLDDGDNSGSGSSSSSSSFSLLVHFITNYFQQSSKRVDEGNVNKLNHINDNFHHHGKKHNFGSYDTVDKRQANKDKELFDPLLHNDFLSVSSSSTKEPLLSQHNTRSPYLDNNIKHHRAKSPILLVNSQDEAEATSSEEIVLNKSPKHKFVLLNRAKTDLKIDEKLDEHLAKLCKVIFNQYITPDWAPYEARHQLRVTVRKLLIIFAERIKITFFDFDPNEPEVVDKTKLINFCKNKIGPILLYHLDKFKSSSPKFSSSSSQKSQFDSVSNSNNSNGRSNHLSINQLKRLNWKVRRLCLQLFSELMPPEQKECKLWIELCVSILGDGVIWNCILLGKDELPKIIEEALENLLLTLATNPATNNSNNIESDEADSSSTTLNCDCSNINHNISNNSSQSIKKITENHVNDDNNRSSMNRLQQCDKCGKNKSSTIINNVPEQQQQQHINIPQPDKSTAEVSSSLDSAKQSRKQVPMLLDSFLDPKYNDVEQPPSIVSRWRPTLNEILIQRDLLYSLIQYLRGERALEYLQAVLDESPDGSAYCRRILELEYLPNFCRSKLFLESLGMSRVDVGVEAGAESLSKSSGSSLKKSSSSRHSRSMSSGGGSVSSGLFKSAGIVEGLAIPPSKMPADGDGLSRTSSSTFTTSNESESSFRKRQHILQPFIQKFYDSVTNFGKQNDPAIEKIKAKRLGIDSKSYEDMNHPDVLSRVSMEPCDIMTCAVEIGAAWLNKASWLESVIISWVHLFHPFLKPRFDRLLDEKLEEVLTLDNFIQFIDLITEAFIESQSTSSEETSSRQKSYNNEDSSKSQLNSSSKAPPSLRSKCLQTFTNWIILNLFDYTQVVTSIHSNREQFILFFVDVLDILVNELTNNTDASS